MKDIVLLSNRPWKHTKYLKQLSNMTGCKIRAFLFSKMYYGKSEFSPPYKKYIMSEEKVSKNLKEIFPQTEIKSVEKIEEIEEFYNLNNTIILADMEPGNYLSYDFCSQKSSSNIIYYSAECRDAIEYVYHLFGKKRVLIPNDFDSLNDCLKYTNFKELIHMVE